MTLRRGPQRTRRANGSPYLADVRLRPRARGALLALALSLASAPAIPGEDALRVSVAISLRPALEESVAAFRAVEPGAPEVLLNGGGSGVLMQQIRRGAPADVLISASAEEIDRLVAERLARPETRRPVAANRLVVIVPRAESPPEALEQLVRSEFSPLVVANPRTAPLGRYTRQALRALGLWDRLQSGLVPTENARLAADYVARGEVAAGIVYASDARRLAHLVRGGPAVDSSLHDPIRYEAIVLAGTRQPGRSAALIEWLGTETGRRALLRHGFLPP